MVGIYNSEMSAWDGLTKGREYQLEEENEEQYLILKNDNNATSRIQKTKFELKDVLLELAEKAVEGK